MADMVTLTGTFQDAAGTPMSGSILFALCTEATDGQVIYSPAEIRVTLDNLGAFSVDLEATDDLTTSNMTYRVTERFNGEPPNRYWIELPGTVDPANLADLATFESPPFVALDPTLAASNVGLTAHTIDTTGVHGITDTTDLVTYTEIGATNLVDYGVDLAGVTAALAAAAGGDLIIPPGTYEWELTGTALSIPEGTRIVGTPGGTTINLTSDANDYRELFTNGGDNVTLQGLTINRADNFRMVLFPVAAGSGFTIRDCIFNGNIGTYPANYCHAINLGVDNGTFNGLHVLDTTFTGLSYGLLQQTASTATVDDVSFTRCVFDSNLEDDLEFNAPNGTMTDIRVTNSIFRDNASTDLTSGFAVGFAHVVGAVVQGNSFNGYNVEAVHIEDYSDAIMVRDNTFININVGGDLFDCSYIEVITGSRRVSIVGNQFDLTNNTNQPIAARFAQGGDGVTAGGREKIPPLRSLVANNDMTCFGGNGVMLETTTDCVVSDNRIIGNGSYTHPDYAETGGTYGVQLSAGVNNAVTGNVIRGFVGGFFLRTNEISSGGTGFLIAGNIVTDCRYGIPMVNTGAGVITGNLIKYCEHPILTGQGPAITRPVVVTGNHAYGCTYPMEIDGTLLVVSTGTASVGTGQVLDIEPLGLTVHVGKAFTFTGGGTLTVTVQGESGDTTLTGDVTGAGIASGEAGTCTTLNHSDTGANNYITNSGNGDFVALAY